jgi:oligopeptide/dipeptide ABC transporter ATP-binding protein
MTGSAVASGLAGLRGSAATDPVLAVRGLSVQFRGERGWATAVRDVDFEVGPRECLGLVGESGSGKSVSALSILGLHDKRNTRLNGQVLFGGRDLLTTPERAMRRIRGREIAMVFQDPMSSLNPVLTLAEQLIEPLRLHQGLDERAARQRALVLLDMVRIADAARRIDDYPHRLSGGQRQRVMIAMAIACQPQLLIADEPTTALDVTIQSQILELLRELQQELGMSLILITHDLGVIAQFAQRVVVMYAGQVIETAPVGGLFDQPLHPYTSGLLAAVPRIEGAVQRLQAIPGSIPDPAQPIAGCRFHPRCPQAEADCLGSAPPLAPAGPGRQSRCPPRLLQALGPAIPGEGAPWTMR